MARHTILRVTLPLPLRSPGRRLIPEGIHLLYHKDSTHLPVGSGQRPRLPWRARARGTAATAHVQTFKICKTVAAAVRSVGASAIYSSAALLDSL